MVRVQTTRSGKTQPKKSSGGGGKGQGGGDASSVGSTSQVPAAQKNCGGHGKRKVTSDSGGVVSMCAGCGVTIHEDSRALQCDYCQAGAAWKCTECLGISNETYDALSEEGGCLKWFCEGCEKSLNEPRQGLSGQSGPLGPSGDRVDTLLTLMEKLIGKFDNVEARLAEKVSTEVVQKLEDRIRSLEEKMASKADLWGMESGSASDQEVLESVVKTELRNKLEEDSEIEKRKNNVILYRVPEDLKEDPAIRKDKDTRFITEMCSDVFGIELNPTDMQKMYRLGRPVEGGMARPLLVSFSTVKVKTELMENLRNLRDSNLRYKAVGIAHDLTPRQRAEVKRVLEDARNAQGTEQEQGNFKFIVVGQNTKPRVIKVNRRT
jgi:hypothetical protein